MISKEEAKLIKISVLKFSLVLSCATLIRFNPLKYYSLKISFEFVNETRKIKLQFSGLIQTQ